jgi:hypothetical protein
MAEDESKMDRDNAMADTLAIIDGQVALADLVFCLRPKRRRTQFGQLLVRTRPNTLPQKHFGSKCGSPLVAPNAVPLWQECGSPSPECLDPQRPPEMVANEQDRLEAIRNFW